MHTCTIKGKINNVDIDVTITSSTDGKAVGMFVADVYTEVLSQAPTFMDKVSAALPTVAKAMDKLGKAFDKIKKNYR